MDKELFDFLRSMQDDINNKFIQISSEMSEIQSRIVIMGNDITSLKSEISDIMVSNESISNQVNENVEILKAIRYTIENHKAYIDRQGISIAHLEGDTELVKNNIIQITNDYNKLIESVKDIKKSERTLFSVSEQNCSDIMVLKKSMIKKRA